MGNFFSQCLKVDELDIESPPRSQIGSQRSLRSIPSSIYSQYPPSLTKITTQQSIKHRFTTTKDLRLAKKHFHKSISTTKLDISLLNHHEYKSLGKTLSTSKSLYNLNINTVRDNEEDLRRSLLGIQDDEDIKTSGFNLTFLTCLSKLTFILQLDSKNSQSLMRVISTGLKNLKHLSDLTIHLNGKPDGYEKDIARLYSNLKHLPSLANLTLHFSSIPDINQVIQNFPSRLVRLKALSSLSLNFEDCSKFTIEGFQVLSSSLKHLKLLSALTIDFTFCTNITNKYLGYLFDRLKSLRSLSNLTLRFNYMNQIYGDGIKNLTAALSQCSSLSALSLAFNSSKIADKEAAGLLTCLQSFQSLSSLSLNFKSCINISLLTIDELSSALMKHTYLKVLILNFSGCKEAYRHLKNLFDAAKYLKKLSILTLKLEYYDHTANDAINSLASTLGHLQSLSALTLSFNKATKMTDERISGLISSMQYLSALTRLSLNFSSCDQIGNQTMYNVSSALKKLQTLNMVELRFSECNKIDDKGLKGISSSLQHLRELSSLVLDFNHCEMISAGGLEKLFGKLKYLNRSADVSLTLSRRFSKNYTEVEENVVALKRKHTLPSLTFNDCKL